MLSCKQEPVRQAKQTIQCLSLLFSYLKAYYSDDLHDNMYVDHNLRRLWKSEGREKLTPLRNWELNEKYKVSTDVKLTKMEGKRYSAYLCLLQQMII